MKEMNMVEGSVCEWIIDECDDINIKNEKGKLWVRKLVINICNY